MGKTLYALYVYPAKNAWIRENAGEFNAAVLAIDPQATGVTVQIHESGSLIVDGFGKSVVYALIAILLLLLLDLRRPLAMLLALFPLFTSLCAAGRDDTDRPVVQLCQLLWCRS